MTNRERVAAVCRTALNTGNIPDERQSYRFYADVLDVITQERRIITCGECAKYNYFLGKCGRIPHPPEWFCADGRPKE